MLWRHDCSGRFSAFSKGEEVAKKCNILELQNIFETRETIGINQVDKGFKIDEFTATYIWDCKDIRRFSCSFETCCNGSKWCVAQLLRTG